MTRRSEQISHVAIELREEHWAREFRPRLATLSGCWEPSLWRHWRIWRIEAAIHFRMPRWRVVRTEGGERVVVEGWRTGPVEWIEHWVYASHREMAIACLVRDLRADPRAEFISHAAIYRVLPPPTKAEGMELDRINNRLARERAQRQDRPTGVAGRQMAFL
jgi:hypothetical protein